MAILTQNQLGAAADSSIFELFDSVKSFISGLLDTLSFNSAPVVAQRTACDEADELRTYATQFISTDPSFAHDLFFAANHHER